MARYSIEKREWVLRQMMPPLNRTVAPGEDDTASITLTTTNNMPPVISNTETTIHMPENLIPVTTITASDSDGEAITYSIAGGSDAGKFRIDPASGLLTFITAPDFENPHDSNRDNIYEVSVTATAGALSDTISIVVYVENDLENTPPAITSLLRPVRWCR